MSAAVLAHKDQYLRLMRQFKNSEIDGRTFKMRFLKMRSGDLRADDEIKKSWPEPHDQQLINEYKNGRLTDREFSKKWCELWGYPEKSEWLEIFSELFTVVEKFEPDEELYKELSKDDPTGFITEEQLKDAVRSFLEKLEPKGNF